MKKFLFAMLIICFYSFSIFSQNQISLSVKEQEKLLHSAKLIDSKGNKISIQGTFTCLKPAVPDSTKGIYFFFSNIPALLPKNTETAITSPVVYVENSNKNGNNGIIDFFQISKENLLMPVTDPKDFYFSEYIKFDDYGRAFISSIDCWSQINGITVFYPETGATHFYPLPDKRLRIMSFEISDDGKFIMIHSGIPDTLKNKKPEKSNIYLINTTLQDNFEKLFEFDRDHISQIHFNSSNKSFSFLSYYKDDKNENGIYILPFENGRYNKEKMNYFSAASQGLSFFNFENSVLIKDPYSSKLYTTDYSPWKRSNIYEVVSYENRIDFEIPIGLEGLFLQKNSNNEENIIFEQNALGLGICTENTKFYSYKRNHLTSYKNKNEYEAALKKEQIKLSQNNTIYETERLVRTNLALIVISIILTIALLFSILYFIIKNRKKHNGIGQKQILQIQEDEKAKISRDIHDTVVQDLRAIRVQAESLKTEDSNKQERLIDDITNCIVKMRNICYNLTPAELATYKEDNNSGIELISIIDTLCRQFYTKTKIPCSIQIEENLSFPSFSKEVSTNIVRVFQEILNNIEKHSYATKTSVLIRTKEEDNKKFLVIFVIDDGVGCDLKEVEHRRRKNHFGMQNIKDRMKQIGANIEFFSMPNQGMKIKLVIETRNNK